jgi:hypothetical protein
MLNLIAYQSMIAQKSYFKPKHTCIEHDKINEFYMKGELIVFILA